VISSIAMLAASNIACYCNSAMIASAVEDNATVAHHHSDSAATDTVDVDDGVAHKHCQGDCDERCDDVMRSAMASTSTIVHSAYADDLDVPVALSNRSTPDSYLSWRSYSTDHVQLLSVRATNTPVTRFERLLT